MPFCCNCGGSYSETAEACPACGTFVKPPQIANKPPERWEETQISADIKNVKRRAIGAIDSVYSRIRNRKAIAQRQEAELIVALNSLKLPTGCITCGLREIHNYSFAMAKVIDSNWGEQIATAAGSVVFSAITVPLVGFGRLSIAGKRESLSVIRFNLLLCERCHPKNYGVGTVLPERIYKVHPGYEMCVKYGFRKFLNAYDLSQLQTTP